MMMILKMYKLLSMIRAHSKRKKKVIIVHKIGTSGGKKKKSSTSNSAWQSSQMIQNQYSYCYSLTKQETKLMPTSKSKLRS